VFIFDFLDALGDWVDKITLKLVFYVLGVFILLLAGSLIVLSFASGLFGQSDVSVFLKLSLSVMIVALLLIGTGSVVSGRRSP